MNEVAAVKDTKLVQDKKYCSSCKNKPNIWFCHRCVHWTGLKDFYDAIDPVDPDQKNPDKVEYEKRLKAHGLQ